MTDATNPGNMQVWGQRRQANGLFPSAGGAGMQPPLGTPAKEKRDPESPYYDPCALGGPQFPDRLHYLRPHL